MSSALPDLPRAPGSFGALVDLILGAERRVRPYVRETYVERSDALASAGDPAASAVWLKCENLQHTGSFKPRGALNKILALGPDALARGVVTASTGNHGRGVAHALSVVGARGTIYLPTTVPASKVAALKRYPGVTLERYGTDSAVTEAHARAAAEQAGQVYVSPYNDLDVIAGQGTIGVELERQCPALDAVFVAVGGGGLISGVAAYLKACRPGLRVIGCWPERSPALYAALQAGRIVDVPELPTLSDGTAGGVEAGAITFGLARELIDECVLVSEDEIADAMRLVLAEHHLAVEGAAGVAVAAYRKTAGQYAGRNVAIVLCGGNVAYSTIKSVMHG
jgi:threonine dehydratase